MQISDDLALLLYTDRSGVLRGRLFASTGGTVRPVALDGFLDLGPLALPARRPALSSELRLRVSAVPLPIRARPGVNVALSPPARSGERADSASSSAAVPD